MLIMAGALTPTEVIAAWNAGADFVKIFPCGNVGRPQLYPGAESRAPANSHGADGRRECMPLPLSFWKRERAPSASEANWFPATRRRLWKRRDRYVAIVQGSRPLDLRHQNLNDPERGKVSHAAHNK